MLIQPKKRRTPAALDTTKQLLNYTSWHNFSDTSEKDNFNITLYGQSMIAGTVVFKIINGEQNRIYQEIFPASDLLGDEIDELSLSQQQDTIKVRMAHFFDNENFDSPAIDKSDKAEDNFYDPDKSQKADWEDVKSDAKSVGFIYSRRYESTFGIAYSKKKKKVVRIFESD